MTRYAILGAEGMLGRAFAERARDDCLPVQLFSRRDFDIASPKLDFSSLDEADVIINCAAYTNVDAAEGEEEVALAVNGIGVGRLAAYSKRTAKKLVHFSTDYVFDGLATRPYTAYQTRAPLNAYGRTKACGEELLGDSGAEFLCLRTSWVYAPWGKNFVLTMRRLLEEKSELRVVNDQRGRPSSARELVKNTLRLLEVGAAGFVHLSDSGECSWFEFACEIQRQLGTVCRLIPCTSSEFPRPAPRPAYSVLDLEETENLIGSPLNYRVALAAVLSSLATG